MIYYFCPDYDVPSWGVGMLYYHVHFLNKNKIEASILHAKSGFKLSWMDLNIPICYIDKGIRPGREDILIVPEGYFADKTVQKFKCRKILFVQNAFILFERLPDPAILKASGFEAAFYYMPHLRKILSAHLNIPIYETQAFIADYYYCKTELLHNRKKQIVIYPKTANRDYEVIYRFLHNDFKQSGLLQKIFASSEKKNNWKIIILKDLSHKEVAKVMKEAAFFICLNTHEAFNSSVPEAMAAGCINFTYDALGPADFLEDHKNAFVFNNNHVFELYEKLLFYMKHYDEDNIINELNEMREIAFKTANLYTTSMAEQAIVKIFRQIL